MNHTRMLITLFRLVRRESQDEWEPLYAHSSCAMSEITSAFLGNRSPRGLKYLLLWCYGWPTRTRDWYSTQVGSDILGLHIHALAILHMAVLRYTVDHPPVDWLSIRFGSVGKRMWNQEHGIYHDVGIFDCSRLMHILANTPYYRGVSTKE